MYLKLQFMLKILLVVYLVNGEVINHNVERAIDLSSHLVKTTSKIDIRDSDGRPIKEYVLPVREKNMAFISAKDESNRELKYRRVQLHNEEQFVFVFFSSSPNQEIYIETISSQNIVPYPEKISQNDKQFVKYTGDLYLYSPYKTKLQKTSIKLSSSNIISHTQIKPFAILSNKITLGPYSNIGESQQQALIVHYENQSPFLTVNSLERSIEVSHWGNIAVKENIQMTHTGAKLKGSFSRYDFQKDGRSGQAAVKSYKTILPASATGVYYRDTNGNISTSNMNVLRDSVDLELRPRFPLFGGWKTQYTLGYNVPSYEYLFNVGRNYQLKMRLIDHIYDEMVIEKALIKVILPEGSANIELVTPYPVNKMQNGVFHTYLDTVGRPVVSFTKSNLVESHISDLIIKYTFSKRTMLLEPLLVVFFIFIIFVFFIVCLRLDFSITSYLNKH